MDDEQNAEIMRFNIYNCLIDHNEMKKLAAETFQKIDVINEGQISLEKTQLFINAKELLSKEQIETIYTECLPEDEEQLNVDDFTNYYMNCMLLKVIKLILINEQNYDIDILHNKHYCCYCFSKLKRDILRYQHINYLKFCIQNLILIIQKIRSFHSYFLQLQFNKFYGIMVVVFGFCFCKIQNEQQQRNSMKNEFQMNKNVIQEEEQEQIIVMENFLLIF